ncbi:ankyrin repeat-containing protein [Phlyctema vagabunda]|uniref:Ankyrin repeat-containing protein n=1 Tax=Phlyctema vagabunda TaxID=108571 RepID=A0ABR4P3E4_9HELO
MASVPVGEAITTSNETLYIVKDNKEFLVGKREEAFFVHREVACHYSPVFRAAFNSLFAEGMTQMYRMEDVTPQTFKLLLQWLKFYATKRQDHFDKTASMEMRLIALWVLADRLLMPRLQHFLIACIRDVIKHFGQVEYMIFKFVYDSTPAGSALRRCYTRIAAYLVEPSFDQRAGYPEELVFDVLAELRNQIAGSIYSIARVLDPNLYCAQIKMSEM